MGLELRRIIPHLRNCRRKMFMIFLKLVIGLRMKMVGLLTEMYPELRQMIPHLRNWCRKMFMFRLMKLVIGLRMKTVGPLIDDPMNDLVDGVEVRN